MAQREAAPLSTVQRDGEKPVHRQRRREVGDGPDEGAHLAVTQGRGGHKTERAWGWGPGERRMGRLAGWAWRARVLREKVGWAGPAGRLACSSPFLFFFLFFLSFSF